MLVKVGPEDNWKINHGSIKSCSLIWSTERFVPSQWEMMLLCCVISHWQGTNLEPAIKAMHDMSYNPFTILTLDTVYKVPLTCMSTTSFWAIQPETWNTKIKSLLKSILVNKDFLTWHLIGWQLCCQPIRCQVGKALLTNINFNIGISQ